MAVMTKKYDVDKFSLHDLRRAAERFSNWGRWGADDEAGTLNFVTADAIVAAAQLIRKGRSFSLGLDFDRDGPQGGRGQRFNCVHTMMMTGTDAVAGLQDKIKLRYSDDMIAMALQCGTQWDALSHIFFDDTMWNGYDARLVNSFGAQKNGIEKVKNKIAGRGVLLDVARHFGVNSLEAGIAITSDDLDAVARAQRIEIRRGDFVLIRTGHMEAERSKGHWDDYIGPAPGLAFETCRWIFEREISALATDTWCCEVFPNETDDALQPWHWVVIPKIGLTVGEMFELKSLADDCAQDSVYEFFFCAPPLPIAKAVGSPVNPIAIK